MPSIGQSIVFKGELSGDEDLEIDGQIEGNVRFDNNQLTIGKNGHVQAEVHAKAIIVIGRVTGNLRATERIEIQSTGVVDGDIQAPKLQILEGAVLNGRIDMVGASGGAAQPSTGGSPSTSGSPNSEVRQSA